MLYSERPCSSRASSRTPRSYSFDFDTIRRLPASLQDAERDRGRCPPSMSASSSTSSTGVLRACLQQRVREHRALKTSTSTQAADYLPQETERARVDCATPGHGRETALTSTQAEKTEWLRQTRSVASTGRGACFNQACFNHLYSGWASSSQPRTASCERDTTRARRNTSTGDGARAAHRTQLRSSHDKASWSQGHSWHLLTACVVFMCYGASRCARSLTGAPSSASAL